MASQDTQTNRQSWQLPFGFFAGPILWGIQLLAGYGLAPVACSIGSKWPLYLLVGISGLIVLLAALVAYRAWGSTNQEGDSLLMETDEAQPAGTFLAISGFAVSLLFFLLILATFVAAFFLSPCPNITMILP